MTVLITDLLAKASSGVIPLPTTLASQKASGASSCSLSAATGWPTDTPINFLLYQVTAAGAVVAGSLTVWKGILSGTTVGSLTLKGGTDATYPAGSICVMAATDSWANDLITAIQAHANPDGSLKTAAVQAALNVSSAGTDGWTALATPPSSPTYNGQRSYQVVFPSVDYTDRLSLGTRLKLPRTVAAPTKCTLLNGTNQYYSKSAPAGMTFTDDFVVYAHLKLNAYPTAGNGMQIAGRMNGTSGWILFIDEFGRVVLSGYNAGVSNYSRVISYNAVPLNKWVNIVAQLDMSSFTNSATTSYVMIDGVDSPCLVTRAGTAPTALVQAGNLEIGSNSTIANFAFSGKLAQVAIFSAKVTQATMRTLMGQTLTGSETSLISAYSFNNSISDLAATGNNLTAQNSAVATNADSPFAQDLGTNEYGIITAIAFSTDTTCTVQVPEGCMLPTTGGLGACSYSTAGIPYGFPRAKGKWRILALSMSNEQVPIGSINQWYGAKSNQLTVPIGEWRIGLQGEVQFGSTIAGIRDSVTAFLPPSPVNPTAGILSAGQTISSRGFIAASSTDVLYSPHAENDQSLAAQTLYTIFGAIFSASGSENWYVRGQQNPMITYADNSYL